MAPDLYMPHVTSYSARGDNCILCAYGLIDGKPHFDCLINVIHSTPQKDCDASYCGVSDPDSALPGSVISNRCKCLFVTGAILEPNPEKGLSGFRVPLSFCTASSPGVAAPIYPDL